MGSDEKQSLKNRRISMDVQDATHVKDEEEVPETCGEACDRRQAECAKSCSECWDHFWFLAHHEDRDTGVDLYFNNTCGVWFESFLGGCAFVLIC